MKEKIDKYLSGNLSLRILSLVLAVCLWVLVINTEDPITTRTFSGMEVEITNANALSDLNQTYQIASGEKITFSIKGKKTIVDKLKRSDFVVTADLSELSSVNAVPIKVTSKKYSDDIEIILGNDKTMTLEIEDLQQVQVPVVAETNGKPADGYSIGKKITNPNLISVKGPVSIVKNIKQVRVAVNVDDVSSDIVTKVEPVCYDSDGNIIDTRRVTLDVDKIKVKVEIWKTKKLPLTLKTIGKPASGYVLGTIDYEPKYISVTGETKDLAKISKLELPSIDVTDKKATIEKTIDLNDVAMPDGISLAQEENEVMVKVNIDETTEKDLTIKSDDIQILNNTNHYDIKFEESSKKIHLTGLKDSLKKASVENLRPKIDIKNLKPGSHTVTIDFEEIKNVKVSGNQTVKVTIVDKNDVTTNMVTTAASTTDTEEEE